MKTIGIIIRKLNIDNNDFLGTRLDVFDILKKYNVNTIGIPITNSFAAIKKSVKLCDGIILSGGFYNSENDYKLIKYLYENDIPTLGICLGMQGMAMTYNNKMEKKIKNHNSLEEYVHYINIKKDTLLYKIIGSSHIKVNSRHNFSISKTNFTINATSENDNIIEGLEDSSKKFFLGVQWHPESLTDDVYSDKLFSYFINNL